MNKVIKRELLVAKEIGSNNETKKNPNSDFDLDTTPEALLTICDEFNQETKYQDLLSSTITNKRSKCSCDSDIILKYIFLTIACTLLPIVYILLSYEEGLKDSSQQAIWDAFCSALINAVLMDGILCGFNKLPLFLPNHIGISSIAMLMTNASMIAGVSFAKDAIIKSPFNFIKNEYMQYIIYSAHLSYIFLCRSLGSFKVLTAMRPPESNNESHKDNNHDQWSRLLNISMILGAPSFGLWWFKSWYGVDDIMGEHYPWLKYSVSALSTLANGFFFMYTYPPFLYYSWQLVKTLKRIISIIHMKNHPIKSILMDLTMFCVLAMTVYTTYLSGSAVTNECHDLVDIRLQHEEKLPSTFMRKCFVFILIMYPTYTGNWNAGLAIHLTPFMIMFINKAQAYLDKIEQSFEIENNGNNHTELDGNNNNITLSLLDANNLIGIEEKKENDENKENKENDTATILERVGICFSTIFCCRKKSLRKTSASYNTEDEFIGEQGMNA